MSHLVTWKDARGTVLDSEIEPCTDGTVCTVCGRVKTVSEVTTEPIYSVGSIHNGTKTEHVL